MKQKDLIHLESVSALFSMCYCMDELLDEITEDHLPEMLEEPYKALKLSIHSIMESMETYRKVEKDTFMSACED